MKVSKKLLKKHRNDNWGHYLDAVHLNIFNGTFEEWLVLIYEDLKEL